MKKVYLPFQSTQNLRGELIRNYLIPSLDWLADVQDKNSETALAAKLGSPWETAYTIIAFFRSKPLLEENGGFQGEYTTRIFASVDYLIDRVQEEKTLANWDGGLYDTSIVVRALIYFTIDYPSAKQSERCRDLSQKGILWLAKQVDIWEHERYSFGLADLSQTLRTFLMWEEENKSQISAFLQKENLVIDDYKVDEFIVDYILREFTDEKEAAGIEKSLEIDDFEFGDLWNVSEGLLGLISYYNLRKKSSVNNPERLNNIARAIQQGLRFFERQHVDGRWGLPDVTSLALLTYIRGYSIWNNMEPETHIIFKTIRWLCDEKQFFKDGSILHSINHTVFFSLAIIDICNRWITSGSTYDLPVIELYDLVLWQMPSRTSAERAKRLETQGKLEHEELVTKNLHVKITAVSKRLQRWQLAFVILSWLLFGIVLSVLFGFVGIKALSVTTISVPVLSVSTWEAFLTFLSIWISLGVFLARQVGKSSGVAEASHNASLE